MGQWNPKGPYKYRSEDEGAGSERFGDARLLALKIKKEATSQGVQMPLKAGKNKEINSPREYLERFWPCQHFDFRPVRQIWTSDLQNYKIKQYIYILHSKFYAPPISIICYRYNISRKLIQESNGQSPYSSSGTYYISDLE